MKNSSSFRSHTCPAAASSRTGKVENAAPVGGLAGWLLNRLGGRPRPMPKLALLERITLAPRQTVSLIEADGRRLLIATSTEGAPAFYALDEKRYRVAHPADSRNRSGRVSW